MFGSEHLNHARRKETKTRIPGIFQNYCQFNTWGNSEAEIKTSQKEIILKFVMFSVVYKDLFYAYVRFQVT